MSMLVYSSLIFCIFACHFPVHIVYAQRYSHLEPKSNRGASPPRRHSATNPVQASQQLHERYKSGTVPHVANHASTLTPSISHKKAPPVYAIQDNPLAFWNTYDKYIHVCNTSSNIVRPRPRKDDFIMIPPEHRWSMTSGLMHAMLGVENDFVNATPNYNICKAEEDITQMFASIPKEQHCRLQWFEPSSFCSIFKKFSFVYFDGDSLLRMMMQGLHMISSDNWANGSYPCGHPVGCFCDGQVCVACLN